MAKKTKKTSGEALENIESSFSKTEQFIEKNQKMLMWIMVGILIIVVGYWLFMNYKSSRELDAQSQMFVAEQNFEVDSFRLAINGAQSFPGLIEIADDFGGTKVGNMANYLSGVSYMNLGEYDNAIDYLKKFSTSDIMLSTISKGLIGDAYVEKGEYDKAIKYYKQATGKNKNNFTTPVYLKKLGLVYEETNDYQNALKVYQDIFENYKKSDEARTIEKYIERAKAKLGKKA